MITTTAEIFLRCVLGNLSIIIERFTREDLNIILSSLFNWTVLNDFSYVFHNPGVFWFSGFPHQIFFWKHYFKIKRSCKIGRDLLVIAADERGNGWWNSDSDSYWSSKRDGKTEARNYKGQVPRYSSETTNKRKQGFYLKGRRRFWSLTTEDYFKGL